MFFLFKGHTYYPSGGVGDYSDTYTTLEEAVMVAKELLAKRACDWYSVVTLDENNKLVEIAYHY